MIKLLPKKERIKIFEQWIKELRSGKRKQGKGHLCKIEEDGTISECCLGVLCDITKKKLNLEVEKQPYTSTEPDARIVLYNNSQSYLPILVRDALGMEDFGFTFDSALPKNLLGNRDLTILNDAGVSFNEIAKVIERYVKWLKEN